MTVRYIEAQDTYEAAKQWCADRELAPIHLEEGPDGRVRGIAGQIDEIADHILRRARALR